MFIHCFRLFTDILLHLQFHYNFNLVPRSMLSSCQPNLICTNKYLKRKKYPVNIARHLLSLTYKTNIKIKSNEIEINK